MITTARFLLVVVLSLAMISCGGKSKEELFAEGSKQIMANPSGALILFKSALEKDPNFIDARYQVSKAYMALGKYEQAEKEFQKVLRQDPSRLDVKLDLARLYINLKKPDDAIREAKTYLQSKPDSPDALEVIAIANAANNQIENAEKYLLQTLKVDPGRVSAKLELAVIYQMQRRETDSRRMIDEVIKGDPQNTRAYYLLAAIEASQGKTDRTLEIYRKISEIDRNDSNALYKSGIIYSQRGDFQNAERIAAQLAQQFPKGADGPRLKGIILYTKRNYTDAITELQTSLKIRQTVEGHYFLGLAMFSRGDLESALSEFRIILDHNPTFIRARLLLAMTLLKQQRLDDAITEARKTLESDPQSALAHNVLGTAYVAKGLTEDGMRELQKATELDPKIVDAHLKKGFIHLSKGRVKEAETDLTTAVKVAPDAMNTRLLLAAFHQRNRNTAKAVSVINQGLTGKSTDAPFYNYLAGIMFSQNKAAEGLTYLDKSKKADPNFFAAYANTATYYASKGDYDRALVEYQQVIAKDPGNVSAMLNSAALLEIKGKDGDAFKWYRKAADTKNERAYLTLAAYYTKRNETGKALKVLDEALRSNPKSVAAGEAKGGLLLVAKKYKEAIKVFDEIAQVNPERAQALKVTAYVAAKDFSKATEEARWYINQKPNSAQGYLLLSAVYESQNDLTRAIDEVKKGLRVDPKNGDVAVRLGNLHRARKDYNAALAAYDDAIRRQPDNATALYAQGALLETLGKRKEAINKYKETLAKSEKHLPALNNLAYLYADGYGKPEEALRLAISAFKLEPGNPGTMDTLGYALFRNRRLDDAQKVLEKAVVLSPNNPTILYHLALVYKEKGVRDLALTTLQKSLGMGDFPEAGAVRKLLADMKR